MAGAALAGAGALALTSCYHPASGGTLYRLRLCETGGNYRMHTYAGGVEYGGAYGFNVRIWRAQGHSPDPQYAPAALQDSVELSDMAQLGVHRSNPGCAAKLGL
jgi:hypothetical protein